MNEKQFLAQKAKVDVSQIFLVFMSLVGDVPRTAIALDLDPEFVERLAQDENWPAKVKSITLASKQGDKPGEFERAVNRALNYVQTHRIRAMVDGMIFHFAGKTPEQLVDALSTRDKHDNIHVSARFFADLASAAEKLHAMSYEALGDTARERSDRKEVGEDGVSTASIHASLIAALNSAAANTAPAEELLKETIAKALPAPAEPSAPSVPTEASEAGQSLPST